MDLRDRLVIVGNANTLNKDAGWKALLAKHKASVVKGVAGAERWIEM